MYSNVSIRQVGETNSSYLVDDIRRKIYFREIIPCLTATKVCTICIVYRNEQDWTATILQLVDGTRNR